MRRLISAGSVLIAVAALGLVLYNATLVDRRPPGIAGVTLSAPFGDDPLVGQTVTAVDIQFSEPVRKDTVERRFRIEPYVAGTITWDGQTTAIFTPAQPLPADTAFQVSVTPGFEDLAGNAAGSGLTDWAFRTVGPPVVAQTDPVDGAADVPVDAAIRLTFDRLMDTASVERALRIDPSVTVRPAWSGRDLTLRFDSPLQFGTAYTVTVGTAAADTGGIRLSAAFSTEFSTVPAGLRIDAVVPAAGVAGISVRSPVAIVFDRPIDPASVSGAIRITPAVPGDTRVVALPTDAQPPSSASPAPARNVLLFVPSTPLAAHTTYSVTLDSVVRRLDGDEVAAGQTWSFTTGGPTASAQNQVAFLSIRSGVRNVWLMNPDGSNPRQLTSELTPVSAFDVSADGSRIAWASGGAIKVMQTNGTGDQTLTAPDRFEYAPRFSPDGRTLLVGRRDAAGGDLGYWLVPLPGVVDAPERQLVPDGAPPVGSTGDSGSGVVAGEGTTAWTGRAAFDPTGRFVLLTTAVGDVYLIDLAPPGEAGPPAVTATGLVASAGGAWSQFDRGFLIAARRSTESDTALWSVPPDEVAQRHEAAAGSVAVSPEGLVAFIVRDAAGVGHVATRRASEIQATPLTTGDALADRSPAFGPEGQVVFVRVSTGAQPRSAGIWLADPATRTLTPLSTDGSYPRWLP